MFAGQQVAEVARETSQFTLEVYSEKDGGGRRIPVDSFLAAVEDARNRLAERLA